MILFVVGAWTSKATDVKVRTHSSIDCVQFNFGRRFKVVSFLTLTVRVYELFWVQEIAVWWWMYAVMVNVCCDGECIGVLVVVCNCAVHKKCHDKILGKCTGTAKDSRETKVTA